MRTTRAADAAGDAGLGDAALCSAVRAKLSDAIDVMVRRKISELPVVDEEDRPIGLIDITDVLGLEHATEKGADHFRMKPDLEFAGDSENMDWNDEPSTLRLFGPDNYRGNS
jgi:arabinose-5-phosphate isomerase